MTASHSHAKHHPDDATLLAYAAGTLDEAFVLVVASHLAECGDCRARVRLAEQLGGALLEQAGETGLTQGALQQAMSRIDDDDAAVPEPARYRVQDQSLPGSGFEASSRLPVPLERLLGSSLDRISWRRAAPGVRIHRVKLSPGACGSLHLLRIEPGRKVPDHGHGGAELTLVLKGSYSDAFGRFGPGDVSDLDINAEHCPVVDPQGECICVIATEAPARFGSIFSRLLQPFFGI